MWDCPWNKSGHLYYKLLGYVALPLAVVADEGTALLVLAEQSPD